jgi:hypothetical protein
MELEPHSRVTGKRFDEKNWPGRSSIPANNIFIWRCANKRRRSLAKAAEAPCRAATSAAGAPAAPATSDAAAAATSAASAATAPATPGELHAGANRARVLFVEEMECRQADVGHFFFAEIECLRRRKVVRLQYVRCRNG